MSGLISSDPLATMAMEAGLVRAPLAEGAAQGDTQLDAKQRAAAIGEPVPIVFCRRDESAGTGGVLISPGATEARFSNDASNAVTASYHLVLSEGRIGSIQVRDVFQRSCRVGSHSQTYNRRAGTWAPGNFITAQAGYTTPECPYYCGTVGTYTGMSTLSFQNTIPDGFDLWNRQVHCFIRNGMEVKRLLDNVDGSSNNFADLAYWSFVNCAKLHSSQIDRSSLVDAARFLQVNGFNCDINITESQNLGELLSKMAPYFLLAETRVAGRRGLRPLLPVNSDGTIKTTAIEWQFTFTEDHILPDQLTMSYIPSADRKPFAVRTIWRQQLDDDLGIIRSSEIRIAGEAEDGPYEQHDLSAFATRENHAVKVGAYIRARRKYVTHTVSVSCRAIDFPPDLAPGDIVQLLLKRISTSARPDYINNLYQVERITKTAIGDVSMQLVHFPVDDQGCSLVAKAVSEAVGTGIMLTSNRTGVSCDVPGRSTDTSVPAETGQSGGIPAEPGQPGGSFVQPVSWIYSGEKRPTLEPPIESAWPSIGLYVHSVQWDGQELVIKVQGTPTGLGSKPGSGVLQATLKNGTVRAYSENGAPVNVASLPQLNITATIIAEENASERPSPNEVFQGEVRVQYSASDFPDPEIASYYEMPIMITAPTGGGFSSVDILNSGIARFDAIPQQPDANGFTGRFAFDKWFLNNYYAKPVGGVFPWQGFTDQSPSAIVLRPALSAVIGLPNGSLNTLETLDNPLILYGLYELSIDVSNFPAGAEIQIDTYNANFTTITSDSYQQAGNATFEWSRTLPAGRRIIIYVSNCYSSQAIVTFRNFRHP